MMMTSLGDLERLLGPTNRDFPDREVGSSVRREVRSEETGQPTGVTMRPLPVLVTVLLTAALAYYIYIPLPDAIQEPWRLMLLDAGLRTTMNLVSLALTADARRWSPGTRWETTELISTKAV